MSGMEDQGVFVLIPTILGLILLALLGLLVKRIVQRRKGEWVRPSDGAPRASSSLWSPRDTQELWMSTLSLGGLGMRLGVLDMGAVGSATRTLQGRPACATSERSTLRSDAAKQRGAGRL